MNASINEQIMFRALQLDNKISLLTSSKSMGCTFTLGLFGLLESLS